MEGRVGSFVVIIGRLLQEIFLGGGFLFAHSRRHTIHCSHTRVSDVFLGTMSNQSLGCVLVFDSLLLFSFWFGFQFPIPRWMAIRRAMDVRTHTELLLDNNYS